MFDTQQLRNLIRLERISGSELACRAGLPRHNINRVLNEQQQPSWDHAEKMAAALGRPLSDFDLTENGHHPWKRISWKDFKQINRLHTHIARAESCLMCTQGMEVYLQQPEQFRWTFSRAHQAAGWSELRVNYTISAFQPCAISLEARGNEPSCHYVIAREDWLLRTFCVEPYWADEIAMVLRRLDGKTLLGILPPERWAILDRAVEELIAEAIGRRPTWDKVGVADTTLAFIRPALDHVYVNYHRPIVQAFRTRLAAFEYLVPHVFPIGVPQPAPLRQSVELALSHLEELRVRAALHKENPPDLDSPAEKKYWAKLALAE
jgi:transcriptional regulator with XRE-family HTH domain